MGLPLAVGPPKFSSAFGTEIATFTYTPTTSFWVCRGGRGKGRGGVPPPPFLWCRVPQTSIPCGGIVKGMWRGAEGCGGLWMGVDGWRCMGGEGGERGVEDCGGLWRDVEECKGGVEG